MKNVKKFSEQIFFVMLGGALGAFARVVICTLFINQIFAILLCNIIGSFLFSFYSEFEHRLHPHVKKFHSVGFCGGFTTFSTFALQDANLIINKQFFPSLYLFFSSFFLCIISVFLAEYLVKIFVPKNYQRKKL